MDAAGAVERCETDVAIIGGGLAGMAAAAALSLAEPPPRVQIFEAKRRLGGRAGSFTDRATGDEIDYCQHVAMGCCTNFRELMRMTQLEEHFARSRALTFVLPGHSQSRLAASTWLPAPLHLVPAFLRLRFLSGSEKLHAARVLWKLMRVPHLPETGGTPVTMGDWLRSQGTQPRVMQRFWNVVLASALGDDVDRVAYGPARKVFVDGFLRHHEASEVWVPKLPLSELFGERLARFLRDRGVGIDTGCRVRDVRARGDGGWRINAGGGESWRATAVIAAAPWFALPQLLPSGVVNDLDQFAELPTAPISGIHLWLDGPLTERPHTVIVDRLSQWVFRHPTGSGQREGHYYQVVVSAAHDLRGRPASQVVAQVLEELNEVFECEPRRRCLHSRVVTDPQAVFSVHPEVERIRPATRTRAAGLYLAGDFTRTGWPATMEGAVISGFRAAAAVLRDRQQGCRLPLAGLATGNWARWLIRNELPSPHPENTSDARSGQPAVPLAKQHR
jgi:squalene-associated FAD-dependent desaturase